MKLTRNSGGKRSRAQFLPVCASAAVCAVCFLLALFLPGNGARTAVLAAVFFLSAAAGAALLLRLHRRTNAARDARLREDRVVIRQSGKSILRYDAPTRTVSLNDAEDGAAFALPAELPDCPDALLRRGIVLPESEGELRALFDDLNSGVPSGGRDLHLRLASGERRWFRADFTLLPDASGRLLRGVISVYDNTELREKELAYEKLRSDLAALAGKSVIYLEVNLTTDSIEHI